MLGKIAKQLFTYTLFFGPFILFLALRLNGLNNDMSNSDARRWYIRSMAFSQAVKTFDFAETYQSYHPGVTLMWTIGTAQLGLKAYFEYTQTDFSSFGNTDGFMLLDIATKIT